MAESSEYVPLINEPGGIMGEFFNQKIVLYLGIALMIIGIAGLVRDEDRTSLGRVVSSQVEIAYKDNGRIVSYTGVEGKSALELLKSSAAIKTEESSMGEFVTTINGVEQTNTEYWVMYVNGSRSQTNAANYVTKDDDTIEWRLQK